jgi:hypothetical protein
MKLTRIVSLLSLTVLTSACAQEVPQKVHEAGLVFSSLNNFGLRYKYGNDHIMLRITALALNGSNTSTDYSYYSSNTQNEINSTGPSQYLGGGLNIGIEKRIPVHEKFYLYYGADLINAYSFSKSTKYTPVSEQYSYVNSNNVSITQTASTNNSSNSNSSALSTGIGFVFGGAYKMNENFSIGVEWIPSLLYRYNKISSEGIEYGFNWTGNNTSGYTATTYVTNDIRQTNISRGVAYSLNNSSASITLTYRFKRR